MSIPEKELLHRLGAGESIEAVCKAANLSREEFDRWWKKTIESRVPETSGTVSTAVGTAVEIERDQQGIPHIYAKNDNDLFFGFGYAMAMDRLFQLDYLRRKGLGRLSEILGPDGLELDTIARTVGLNRLAVAEWDRLPKETQSLLEAFSAGINALIEASSDNLPIEFDLLDYRPEPWSPIDSLAIENELRWYLTGRFPVIVMPELARRVLGDSDLYRDYLLGEEDGEAILLPGMYPAKSDTSEPVGQATGDPDSGTGSNNWVIAGSRSSSGKPMVGSDPHIAFEAVSCWYEVHLCGGSFNTVGMAYVGMPAVMIGRNEKVTWGITNNICSQRDLYQEKTSSEHPGCFLDGEEWQPAHELTEVIKVKGSESISKTISFSQNGPIVDEILPPPGNKTGPVSLKWLGAYHGGWLTAMLGSNRVNSVDEFRESLRPWHVPTFNLVFADVDGHIGMQSTGRVPIRREWERGYRPGWDPKHQWTGLIPFDSMPHVVDPERGWMATANHRIAADDYPYPLSGCWVSGYRGRRIREIIESSEKMSHDDFRDLQQDSMSLRAVQCLPAILNLLNNEADERIQQAAKHLEEWNCYSEPDSVGTAIFNVFFSHWSQTVADERFDAETSELLAKGCGGIAFRLLTEDESGWFVHGDRETKIIAAFNSTLDLLAERFGADMSTWTWGRLHQMPLKHVLSTRGDLGELLDHGGAAVRGDMTTVCNTGSGPDWIAASGGGYRMVTDLAASPSGIWAVDGQSQSGQPGSPNYSDQFDDWISGQYHFLALDRAESAKETDHQLRLLPKG